MIQQSLQCSLVTLVLDGHQTPDFEHYEQNTLHAAWQDQMARRQASVHSNSPRKTNSCARICIDLPTRIYTRIYRKEHQFGQGRRKILREQTKSVGKQRIPEVNLTLFLMSLNALLLTPVDKASLGPVVDQLAWFSPAWICSGSRLPSDTHPVALAFASRGSQPVTDSPLAST
ncbi:hypothetical protein LIPSTDRAFT_126692 [Lipomyces starkeyi NRRL Y-11557]|uniref:Uncharacterized protein n=1 Tax=Lipomyces starkeyi NRRL Y-11557 TaxID=675824 RepID=A0A1E3QES5_LIPST|nr:hypothetical protein LIPSTDRAFT_126692 [Lipomyces starkeyi NRRL Y-11557]